MRYTIVESGGTTSIVGPCHALKMLVSACARMPETLDDVLRHVRTLDAEFADFVADGLAVFDEHHVDGRGPTATGDGELPAVFRVVGRRLRQASLEPVKTGLVVFNLTRRRIIQVQNSYAEIERKDRGRLRQRGQPVRSLYYYELPASWQLVP